MLVEQIYAGFKFSRVGVDREKRENLRLAKISRYMVSGMKAKLALSEFRHISISEQQRSRLTVEIKILP